MKHALYIIGEPGVGKSTLAAALTERYRGAVLECVQPFKHRHYANGVTELGGKRDGFPGTDALSMAVQPKAIEFLEDPTCTPLLLAEGDRLANDGYFKALLRAGYDLHIFALIGARVAARRRQLRGSEQDPKWVDSRRTKTLTLMERWGNRVTVADASLPTESLLRCLLDPVSRAFLRED